MIQLPILYSFRRCPYAMRARMALAVSGQRCRLREVLLRDKPIEMIGASPKATVPVLVLQDGTVLEESLAIMDWALGQDDPEQWRPSDPQLSFKMRSLITEFDEGFKHHLDRFKYATRYEGADPEFHRGEGLKYLQRLEQNLADHRNLFADKITQVDIALMPFIRQFANTDRVWFDAQELPKLQFWLEELLQSERFLGVMQKYPVWKSGDTEPVFPSD